MDLKVMKDRYNASSYHPMIDYRNEEYHNEINNIKPLLKKLININTRALDLALFPLNIVEFQYNDIEVLCQQLKNIISSNGFFCLTMEDAIERITIGRDIKDIYDLSTGIHKAFHNIPYVPNRYWLEFKNIE
jgi:hypothetical protein